MKLLKKTNWLLLLIIIISATGMIYYGTQKEGYHVDEMYSYGLANSEYLPFMHFGESGYDVKDWMLEYGAGESFADLFRNLAKDLQILKEYDFQFYNTPIYQDYLIAQANSADTRTTTWVSGQDYVDYLCASESNTFNYASVYYNQRGDVHPPFYYILLHTICSMFPGTFSKWFALSINIVFLLLTICMLYRMVERYLGGSYVALAAAAVYGFSNGLFTNAMFLRMYAVLTFMVVSFCYMHLKISSEEFVMSRKTTIKLMLVTLLGFLTHYYFVIYAIAVAVVFAIWICVRKKWRFLLRYVLTMASTAAIGLCIWPFAVKHVFSGYRGQQSLDIIISGDFYWIKIKLLLQHVIGQLFGGHWWIPIVCGVLLVVAALCYKKMDSNMGKGTLLTLPILFYTVAVAQIVPYYADRYIMCTYPFWCLLGVLSVWSAVRGLSSLVLLRETIIGKKKDLFSLGILIAAVIVLVILNNGFQHRPGYLFTGEHELATVPENSSCVYVLPDGTWNESAEYSLMLSKCDRVAIVYQSNLGCLENTYQHKEGDSLIVVLSSNLEEAAVMPEVKKVLGIQNMEEAFREVGNNSIRIYFQ